VNDALNEAMEKAQAHLEAQEAPETTATPAPEPGETTTTEAALPEPAETRTAEQRARDEAGKFTKAPKPKAAPKASEKPAAAAPKGGVHGAASAAPPAGQGPVGGAAPSPAPSTEPASSALKAPSSLTPVEREAFAKAPKEIQEGLVRIDREVRKVMQEMAPVRQYAQQVQESLRPYESIARANGMDAMSWAGNALQMAASLYAGTPQQRAQTIAKAIQLSGADLGAIDAALQGQAAPQGQPQQVDIQAEIDRRFKAVEAQREQQATLTEAQRFLANPPEFWETVQPDALEILRLDRKRGGNMTPQQAYDRACRFNEDVQSVLGQRKAAEAARTRTAATVQARGAAVSIKSQPAAPMSGGKTKGLDAAARAAAEKLGLVIS
jgi:hypothetical protein